MEGKTISALGLFDLTVPTDTSLLLLIAGTVILYCGFSYDLKRRRKSSEDIKSMRKGITALSKEEVKEKSTTPHVAKILERGITAEHNVSIVVSSFLILNSVVGLSLYCWGLASLIF
ncbi:hypothetical protein N9E48_09920 [Paracoccaceae bacterium]|nr:hypothetical protein [Paracoccaceae bacterium]